VNSTAWKRSGHGVGDGCPCFAVVVVAVAAASSSRRKSTGDVDHRAAGAMSRELGTTAGGAGLISVVSSCQLLVVTVFRHGNSYFLSLFFITAKNKIPLWPYKEISALIKNSTLSDTSIF
jgi:hypothetical protein